jgi:hypothetical protein
MKERGFGLWCQSIQAEVIQTPGFLLYSMRMMDSEYMHGLLEKTINEHPYVTDMDMAAFVEIGIHWRVILLGVKGKIPEEEMVRALHVECSKEQAPVVKEVLSDVYSANAKHFPGGIKLRFVPDIYKVLSQPLKVKVLHLRAWQKRFLKTVVEMTSYEITSLDQSFCDTTSHMASVQEHLMEIRSKERPYLSQFVNMAQQYNSAGVVFTFILQLEAEARS